MYQERRGDLLKIFHTSDWHLGKNLEGRSRIEEQMEFLNSFTAEVDKKNPDIVIISGDVFDTINPPSIAEKLYYNTVRKISDNAKRLVVVIAGNHDSPDKIEAGKNVLEDLGVYVFGYPKTSSEPRDFDGFCITKTSPGYIRYENKKGEICNIIMLPYPSESRLGYKLDYRDDSKSNQDKYNEIIRDHLENLAGNFSPVEINICVSHIFVMGGEPSESERSVELGGSYLINSSSLPSDADYIALGHLHKNQKVSEKLKAYYSGSPIQYSKSERIYTKFYNEVDIFLNDGKYDKDKSVISELSESKVLPHDINYNHCDAEMSELSDRKNKKTNVKNVPIDITRPIRLFQFDSVEKALEAEIEEVCWAYIEIKTDRIITQDEIKYIKSKVDEVIEIKPVFDNVEREKIELDIKKMDDVELFKNFFVKEKGIEPTDRIVNLYKRMLGGVVEDEAD